MAPRPKRIYAIAWTPGKSDVVRTKKVAHERMRAWKEEREAEGWKVHTAGQLLDGYIATSPDGEREAIVLHEYDPRTKERIYGKLPPHLTPEEVRAKHLASAKPTVVKRRTKGRKPVGV